MIEKWAMCICTGMFAHVDRGVFGADVQELAPSTHTCRGRTLRYLLLERVEGWVVGRVFFSKDKEQPFGPQTTPLCSLLPIVNEVGIANCRRNGGRGEAAASPASTQKGSCLLVWDGLSNCTLLHLDKV